MRGDLTAVKGIKRYGDCGTNVGLRAALIARHNSPPSEPQRSRAYSPFVCLSTPCPLGCRNASPHPNTPTAGQNAKAEPKPPSPTRGVPVLPAKVPCTVCGARQVYRPSEVFVGSLPRVWKREVTPRHGVCSRTKSSAGYLMQGLQALRSGLRGHTVLLHRRALSRLP
jgi:hypothetical protein